MILPDDEPPSSPRPDASRSPRTARTHVLIASQFDGNTLVHPVTAPHLGSYEREDEALAEQALFLREHFARSAPEAISRLALPEGATLIEVSTPLPREDLPRKLRSDVAVSFPCVLVPSARPRAPGAGAPAAPSRSEDCWVMIPALHHTFYVERGEPLEEAIRAEIRRIVAAQDPSPWEQVGLLPARAHRLEVLEIPLPDVTRGGGAEALHTRLAERARRRQALAALRAVAIPLHRPAHPPAPLVGRDAELGQLRALLDGKERLGVLLVGPEHAGKSALVRAWLSAAARERPVFSTSGAQLIAGMSGFGQWQERVRDVMEAVERLDAVLYFESLDDLLAERVESGGVDLAGAMRPWLDEGKVRVVAEIRPDRLDGLEGRYWAFFAGLSRLRVEPLSVADTRRAVELLAAHDARTQPDRPRVALDAVPALVDLAERYLPYGAFPGKAVRLYQDLRAAHEQDLGSSGAPRVIGRRELYEIFSLSTGVPELLLRDDTTLRIEDVAARLGKQIIGQERAILGLAETIGVVKAGLQPSGKPLATFLFIGPTGVGKTELARALAGLLFGSPDRMIRFDMSEFMTPDAAERLIRGTDSADGLLTRKVREQPFCVLLLDEIEKAHPAVFDLLLQVCGEGRLTDAAGRTAYFHNVILIMTSNLGAADRRNAAGFTPARADDFAHYQRLVQSSFRQELVNRIDRIVPFRSLTRPEVLAVAGIAVERMKRRGGLDEAGTTLEVSAGALARFAEEGYSEAYGARSLRRHLDEALAAPLGRLLAGLGGEAKDLAVDVTLATEPEAAPRREGVAAAGAEVGGYRFEVRRRKRARGAASAHDHDLVAAARREVDRFMRLAPVEQMKDQLDFLVTQLNLSDREKADRRMARDAAELQAEHHRLAALWTKLVAAQEEVHAVEELAVLSLFEGEPVQPLLGDAERARASFRRVLPYALCALEPRRDEITLMIEELDEGALQPWLEPLLDQLDARGWTAVVHVEGGARLPEDGWPPLHERRWGPPRGAAWLGRELEGGSFKNLLFRCRGPYAGALLALEAGLHRTVLAGKSDARDDKAEDDRRHVAVRTVALRFDVPAEAWADKHLAPPPAASANARRRGPAARERNEPEGRILLAQRRAQVAVDPAVYWARLEEIALEHLLLFESGVLDRDDFFAPPAER